MKYPDGHEIPIWQYTTIRYTLSELKRNKIESEQKKKSRK
jgi:hypothetical protein